jgi:hypothetical protein
MDQDVKQRASIGFRRVNHSSSRTVPATAMQLCPRSVKDFAAPVGPLEMPASGRDAIEKPLENVFYLPRT